ncbi:unnamed protein product [Angiostrongylus costaricensis]|uniref:SUI1 domain-containing protein n=1 Tax=Angiostrongylus costaricensis TaxID=334426 RepID=A0A0R3PK33_ANGCS|nr:unnamed protein product [Angiostrongylus costaricensis]
MFRKPFSLKKNTNLRNSDAKKLLQRLPEKGAAVLPKKVVVAHVKLLAFNGTVVNVYVVDKEPMFFEFDDSGFLFPTLYFAWIDLTAFPTLVVHESVLRHLENGADLMLQGGLYSIVEFYFEFHVKPNKFEVVSNVQLLSLNRCFSSIRFQKRKKPLFQLLRCFLAALKFRLGKLPMDVGQFYSTCLLKCVPSGRRLDMKKTKYKKFSAFLNEVNKSKDGPLVFLYKFRYHSLRSFTISDEVVQDEQRATICGPKICEFYSVTDTVLPILRCCGNYTKGQLLAVSEIRQIVTDYVKREVCGYSYLTIRLDPILADVTRIAGEVTDWNTLIQKIQSKMTKTFVLRMPDGRELVRKISMPKITFKVETRSGNKKVTLINNLAVFGIDTKKLCQQIQVEAATSATTTNEAPNCEGPQITVLGNQVLDLCVYSYK